MENEKNITNDFTASIADIEAMMSAAQNGTNKFVASTLNDTLSDSQSKIQHLADSSKVMDRYNNSITGTSNGQDVQGSFTNYGFSNDTLNWTLWLALYNDSWVFRRAIDKPSQDEVNAGFTLYGKEDYTRIYKAYDRYKSELNQLLKWGALFGGSVGVMLFENVGKEEMSQPINKKKIKGRKFKLYVTDRWYGGFADTTEMVNNMRDVDYGKPKYYNITFPDGTSYKVHHSYVLRYEHRVAPPLIKNGQLMGWGYAEGAHILNELARDDQLKAAITSLVNKSLIEVIKMSGMRGVFMGTDKGNESQLMKRLEMVNWGRSYNSLTFLDKDDGYEQYTMGALSGLADILEKNMWQIAAALEMPGILYGELKGGLSADTDAYKHYSQTILNRCNDYFRPVLNKFLKILFIVYGIKGSVDFDFNSLNRSEDNATLAKSIGDYAQMLTSIEQAGLISKYQSALALKEFINNESVKIEITDEYLNMLKLQEEQKILDTIKELSDKGRHIKSPDFDSGAGSAANTIGNIQSPDFGIEESNEDFDMGEDNSEGMDILEETNINLGENNNNNEGETGSGI